MSNTTGEKIFGTGRHGVVIVDVAAPGGTAKRALDMALAAVMLVFLAPVMIIIATAVCMDGGPAFYGHRRVGRHGRTFKCLKFRSMVPDADCKLAVLLATDPDAAAAWAANHKLPNDPRITRLGAILRATSLDEVPQLINVLTGEMSLVGPRPVVQEELDNHYGEAAAAYLAVRPGITGLWQVSGRSETSYARRIELDVAYVSDTSFVRDLRIFVLTIPAVLLRKGAR